MSPESIFESTGTDALVGAEIMNMLDLKTGDLKIPAKFNRLKEVIGYFKDVPDYRFTLHKITAGKAVDRLDHAYGYALLSKQRKAKLEEMKKLEEEIGFYE